MVVKELTKHELEDMNVTINECYKRCLEARQKFTEQEDTVDKDLAIAVFFYYDNSYSSNAFIELLEILNVEVNYDSETNTFKVNEDEHYEITDEMVNKLEKYYNINSIILNNEVIAYNETEGLESIRHNMRAVECLDKYISIIEFFNCIGYFIDYEDITKIKQIDEESKKNNQQFIKMAHEKRESFREIVIEKLKSFYAYANALVELEIKKDEIQKMENKELKISHDDSEITYLIHKCEDRKREFLLSEAIERKKILELTRSDSIRKDVQESFEKRLAALPKSIKEKM